MRVEIGAGKNRRPDTDLAIDQQPFDGIDIVTDLETGIPLKDNSASKVYAIHVLEHIRNLPELMAEIHRILKPNGILTGKVPHYKDTQAFVDPTHKRFFAIGSWDYWDRTTVYGNFGYFDVRFRVNYSKRVRRIQFWKPRPIRFELEAIKN